MVVLIEKDAINDCFEVQLKPDSAMGAWYMVVYSNCCNTEYIDSSVKGEAYCACRKSSWYRGPGVRVYLIEEDDSAEESVIEWLDYWIIGQKHGVEVSIKW